MDVMTAKMRALQFKQRKLNKDSVKVGKNISLQNQNKIKASLGYDIFSADVKDVNMNDNNLNQKGQIVEIETKSKELKQKNIQLRTDQIKSLREYTFKSGDLKGLQLNESQICRVSLDLFFSMNINPSTVETEEDLLNLAKKSLK